MIKYKLCVLCSLLFVIKKCVFKIESKYLFLTMVSLEKKNQINFQGVILAYNFWNICALLWTTSLVDYE